MFLQHIGNSIWKEDQQFLLNNLNAYCKKIENKKVKKARKIVERLPYLENLLAGVSEIQNYNLKYQPFFGSSIRKSKDKKLKLSNTCHFYSGALRK